MTFAVLWTATRRKQQSLHFAKKSRIADMYYVVPLMNCSGFVIRMRGRFIQSASDFLNISEAPKLYCRSRKQVYIDWSHPAWALFSGILHTVPKVLACLHMFHTTKHLRHFMITIVFADIIRYCRSARYQLLPLQPIRRPVDVHQCTRNSRPT